jgi:hypothetical protein
MLLAILALAVAVPNPASLRSDDIVPAPRSAASPRIVASLKPAGPAVALNGIEIDTIGGTTYDFWFNGPERRLICNSKGIGIHATWIYSNQYSGFSDRDMRYAFSNYTTWNWQSGTDIMLWDTSVFQPTARSGFGSLDADPVSGVALISGHSVYNTPGKLHPDAARDASPGTGHFLYAWGDALIDSSDQYAWPVIGVTANRKVHIDFLHRTYFSGHYSAATWPSWEVKQRIMAPDPGYDDHNLAVSKRSNKVVAVWLDVNVSPWTNAYYRVSNDGGATWGSPTLLPPPNAFGTDTFSVYHITSLFPFFDRQDRMHVVAGVYPYCHDIAWILPAEIWHWSPDNAPRWARIHRASTEHLGGDVGGNEMYADRPSIGQCDVCGQLFVTWEEFDSLNVEPSTGYLRGAVYLACDYGDNGKTWYPAGRLTPRDSSSWRYPCVEDLATDDRGHAICLVDSVAGPGVNGAGAVGRCAVAILTFPLTHIPRNHDVTPVLIPTPVGNILQGTIVSPQVTLKNFGPYAASLNVRLLIENPSDAIAYDTTETGIELPGLDSTVRTFTKTWTAATLGNYRTTAYTILADDTNPANDTTHGTCSVVPAIPTGWTAQADFPAGPKGKRVRDGACLTYYDGGYIYALKGNFTSEFYRFNTLANAWEAKESIPPVGSTGKKKLVKKGGAITRGGTRLFATKGNNTLEFWRYDPSAADAYPWSELAGVPSGAKSLKEGAGLAAVDIGGTTYVYLLKGSGTQEFYRYNTALLDAGWETLPTAPGGVSGKTFKNGSSVVYYPEDRDAGGGVIYALKGTYNEFYAYDVDSGVWTTKAGLPLVGSSGKKKAKDGAGLATDGRDVYALKGGNTLEFWTYQVDSDKWTQLADMPAGAGKKVKGGGAVAAFAGALYALKGNNTLEFFCCGIGSLFAAPDSGQGVASNSAQRTPTFALSVAPNPFNGRTAVRYSLPRAGNARLVLYDVAGKLVTTLATGSAPAGSYTAYFDASRFASGIYLLTFETEGHSATQKLVLE